ncbi:asparaginase, partial [Vibrio sp. 404]|nr:asparaginase [Vibrio marinisediminis]
KLYRANRSTKINAEHFEAFASLNYPELAESGVHLKVNYDDLLRPKRGTKLKVFTNFEENIALVKLFPGISETLLES